MKQLTEHLYYLPGKEDPLSAEVFRIQGKDRVWYYDVGNTKEAVDYIEKEKFNKGIILSHFHPDHIGNLSMLLKEEKQMNQNGKKYRILVSQNTWNYTKKGEIIKEDIWIDDELKLHLFPFPSSHAKGCLAIEIDGYVCLGDALYPAMRKGQKVYNVQLLLEGKRALESIEAHSCIISHRMPFIYSKESVLSKIIEILKLRQGHDNFITMS